MWWNRNKKMCCPCQGCMNDGKVYIEIDYKKFVSLVKGMIKAIEDYKAVKIRYRIDCASERELDDAQRICKGSISCVKHYLEKMDV
jgi:hypothetical protein